MSGNNCPQILAEIMAKLAGLTNKQAFILIESKERRFFSGTDHLCKAFMENTLFAKNNDVKLDAMWGDTATYLQENQNYNHNMKNTELKPKQNFRRHRLETDPLEVPQLQSTVLTTTPPMQKSHYSEKYVNVNVGQQPTTQNSAAITPFLSTLGSSKGQNADRSTINANQRIVVPIQPQNYTSTEPTKRPDTINTPPITNWNQESYLPRPDSPFSPIFSTEGISLGARGQDDNWTTPWEHIESLLPSQEPFAPTHISATRHTHTTEDLLDLRQNKQVHDPEPQTSRQKGNGNHHPEKLNNCIQKAEVKDVSLEKNIVTKQSLKNMAGPNQIHRKINSDMELLLQINGNLPSNKVNAVRTACPRNVALGGTTEHKLLLSLSRDFGKAVANVEHANARSLTRWTFLNKYFDIWASQFENIKGSFNKNMFYGPPTILNPNREKQQRTLLGIMLRAARDAMNTTRRKLQKKQ